MATAPGTSSMSGADVNRSGDHSFVQRHPLLCYFVLAFGLSWTSWIPLYLSQEGLKVFPYHTFVQLVGIGTFIGPALASILVTALVSGRAGLRELFSRILKWRVGLQWYVFAFLGTSILTCIAAPIGLSLAKGQLVTPAEVATLFNWNGLPGAIGHLLSSALLTFLFGGPLGEEIGWRGFALPRLEQVHGPFLGSLILAPLWFLWHVPLIVLYPAYIHNSPPGEYLASFAIFTVLINVYFTFFYNRTGSVFITMLCHTSVNTINLVGNTILAPSLPNNVADSFNLVFTTILLGVPLLIVLVTRGRQGYEPGRWGVLPQPGSQERYTLPRAAAR